MSKGNLTGIERERTSATLIENTTIIQGDSSAFSTTDDVNEGLSNLYFTDARAQAATAGSYDAIGAASAAQAAAATDATTKASAAQAFAIQRGNHTGTQLAATISNFAATVLATVLSGLSTASAAVVAATDTVLVAIGKLQAQISLINPTPGTQPWGTYTPTLTAVTNIAASTSDVFQWHRVGNVVTVSGAITIDPTTASAASRLAISLPIASDLTGFTDCAGVGAMAPTVTGGVAGAICGDATNNRADLYFCTGSEVAARTWGIHFTYTVK